jgi:transposase
MSLRSWWRNENYDRETMRRFREGRPEWFKVPDGEVARSFTYQVFALSEAVKDLRRELAKLIDPEDSSGKDE